jgi:diguanylate cyclase (GGDEF)-like protein
VGFAKYFLFFVFLGNIFVVSFISFPREASFQLFLFITVPFVYLVFKREQKKIKLLLSLLNIFLLLLIELINHPAPLVFPPLQLIRFYKLVTIVASITTVAITASIFARDLERTEKIQRDLAIRDALTGLHNRRYFDMFLEQYGQVANRYAETYSIIFIDIDHFKSINDTWGHDTGDVVLEKMGELLSEIPRGGDLICRYGGEEFVMYLPETTPANAAVFAERLRSRVADLKMDTDNLSITVSIGVSGVVKQVSKIIEVIKKADEALYKAKKAGRNCIRTSFKK